jgi:hypothetical protein
LLAAKLTSSTATAEESILDPRMPGLGRADDTLVKADRLEIAYLLPPTRIPSAETMPELTAQSVPVLRTKSTAIANLQPRTRNRGRNGVMLPRPRPKIRLTKNNHPARLAADVKTCSQPEGLGSILLSFAGSPRCG